MATAIQQLDGERGVLVLEGRGYPVEVLERSPDDEGELALIRISQQALAEPDDGRVFILAEPRLEHAERAQVIYCDGEPLAFSRQEYRLVACFLRNRRCLLSRAQLLAGAWDELREVDERTVEAYVSRVRAHFAGRGLEPITTVRGGGYRWDL